MQFDFQAFGYHGNIFMGWYDTILLKHILFIIFILYTA